MKTTTRKKKMTAIDVESIVLANGKHDRRSDGVCLLEAVAWFAGEKHSDHPVCVSPVLGAFGRNWNDALSDDDRQMLRPYIPRLVGTVADAATEERRAYMAIDWFVREHAPAWLELAGLDGHANAVRSLPEIVDLRTLQACGPILKEARSASAAARDAAGAAAGDAARAAAWDAAGAAVRDAAGAAARAAAGAAARAAAGDAAWAAAGDAAWAAAGDAARDAARKRLRPTVEALQQSALRLLDRMIAASAP